MLTSLQILVEQGEKHKTFCKLLETLVKLNVPFLPRSLLEIQSGTRHQHVFLVGFTMLIYNYEAVDTGAPRHTHIPDSAHLFFSRNFKCTFSKVQIRHNQHIWMFPITLQIFMF